jgi:hypothetical protein
LFFVFNFQKTAGDNLPNLVILVPAHINFNVPSIHHWFRNQFNHLVYFKKVGVAEADLIGLIYVCFVESVFYLVLVQQKKM